MGYRARAVLVDLMVLKFLLSYLGVRFACLRPLVCRYLRSGFWHSL